MENTHTDRAERLAALRAQLQSRQLDAYLVPRADEYLGEYVPECAERLSWLTGFTGSAGLAVVGLDAALVMSDGRYTIQLDRQVDGGLFERKIQSLDRVPAWVTETIPAGGIVGYDPRLHTAREIELLSQPLQASGITLRPVEGNLIDAIRADRADPPATIVEAFPTAIAGRSADDKIQEIAHGVTEEGGSAVVLSAPDSVAWLLNIRASDVPHTPFALSTAILHANGEVDWFIAPDRVPAHVTAMLGNRVRIVTPDDLASALERLGGKIVLLDDSGTPVWFRQRLEAGGATVRHAKDPCVLPRACKTPEEQQSIRDVHVQDGVAMVRFLRWIDENGPGGSVTECDVADRLAAFRDGQRDASFDTIAGWAANAAIVHYRADDRSNATIAPPGLLLVDSGGQYAGGTTDITRTIAIGAPSREMIENNTRVLKGHIAISLLRFPQGLTGRQIDVLARKSLWDAGLDFAHGTGHGVGCYLSVHERGIGISSRAEDEFRPGMLVSNEPGYYKTGAYGIRIENLILVQQDGTIDDGASRTRLCFETVTLAPYDRALIDAAMLEKNELAWLNRYHARVAETLCPLLDNDDAGWLRRACAAIG